MSKVTKAEILDRAKGQLDDLVELVSQLIKIPSENPIGSQRPVIDFVEKYLEDAGIDWEEVGCNEEFPCIVAHMGKEDGFSVILNGHVDVVPAGDREQWDFDPFSGEITEKEILGRGTSDMKAGVAGFLFAMKILKESGAQLNGNIRLHIVSDEESGGEFGTKWLCDNGYAENAGTGEVIDHVAVNVGMIHGGVRPNMVPDYCEAVLDVRLPIGVDEQEIRDCVDNIVKKSQMEGIEYTLDFQSFGNYTEIDAAIVEAIKKHAEELWKIEVLPAYQWASSDAREYREKGIPTIQYGPSNTVGIHSYNETVDIEDVKNAGQIYILSLCDLMGIQ